MFLQRGYGDTTVAAIADAADVSVETVYKAYRNKEGLLKAVVDVAIVGDDEPVPMLQRELVRTIEAEPDARGKMRLYGEHLTRSAPRRAPLEILARTAAATDPSAGRVWKKLQDERLAGMTAFARHLHEAGCLRQGISLGEARDVLWTYISPDVFDLLVRQRGWSHRRYGRWVAEAVASALLP
jgi:AcrR family transcriptional regulator